MNETFRYSRYSRLSKELEVAYLRPAVQGAPLAHARVCDACWEVRKEKLVIVPGHHLVTARCDRCGTFGIPRNFATLRAGRRHGAYSERLRYMRGGPGLEGSRGGRARTAGRDLVEGNTTVRMTHDHIHRYRGYWSEGADAGSGSTGGRQAAGGGLLAAA